MKRKLLIAFVLVILMIVVMYQQGKSLITPVSPNGIIDLEFARNTERYQQLRLFMNLSAIRMNLYLDFIFILTYTWFLYLACIYIRQKTKWLKAGMVFSTLAITTGLLDVAENFLLLLILEQRFQPSLLQLVYILAALKFLLAAMVILYLAFSWPFALRRKMT